MKFLAHINVPANAVIQMTEEYGMDIIDVTKALEAYAEKILGSWDDGAITFFQFLEEDFVGDKEFVKKKKWKQKNS